MDNKLDLILKMEKNRNFGNLGNQMSNFRLTNWDWIFEPHYSIIQNDTKFTIRRIIPNLSFNNDAIENICECNSKEEAEIFIQLIKDHDERSE